MADPIDLLKALNDINGGDASTSEEKKEREQSANILSRALETNRRGILARARQFVEADKRLSQAQEAIKNKYGKDAAIQYALDESGEDEVKVVTRDGETVELSHSNKLGQDFFQASADKKNMEYAIIGSLVASAGGEDGKVDASLLFDVARDLESLEAAGKLEVYHKKPEKKGKEESNRGDPSDPRMLAALGQYDKGTTPAGGAAATLPSQQRTRPGGRDSIT